MALKRFVIAKVLDRKTGNSEEEFRYILNKECFITELEIGLPMIVKFENNAHTFYASVVEDFHEDEYGIWVVTKNMEYRFDDALLLNRLLND